MRPRAHVWSDRPALAQTGGVQERRTDQSIEIGYALLVGGAAAAVIWVAGLLLLELAGRFLGLDEATREALEPVVLGAGGLAGVAVVVRVLRRA